MKEILRKLWLEPIFFAGVGAIAAVELIPGPLGIALGAVCLGIGRQLVTPTAAFDE